MDIFYPNIKYFTDQDGPKKGQHENEFWIFQIQKSILQLERKK